MIEPKTYLFFGNIGAGKGTQVELLKKSLLKKTGKEVVYISPGEEFRKLVKGDGYTSLLAKDILNKGELLPVFLVSWVLGNVLVSGLKSDDSHLIMDGFPRSIEQVGVFESAMHFYKRNNIEIIFIDISKDEAVKRLMLRARHDDTKEGIKKRFEEYENNVVPSLSLLKEKGFIIHNINGENSIEEVEKEIHSKIKI